MSVFLRWIRFNLVGAMGVVVQLASLAFFSRYARGHYLWATATAIELTLLHNFAWHLRYTWRDRCDHSSALHKLVRFHLSNGLVSLLGNLLLMRVLIHQACVPLLAANGIAILACALVNFLLGESWVFASLNRAEAA